MKNPHLFNRLFNWFACFGNFEQQPTEESILATIDVLHQRVDKTARLHKDIDCRQTLNAITLLLILATHHLKKPDTTEYLDAKKAIQDARVKLYKLKQSKTYLHAYSLCKSDHSFFSLRKDMKDVSKMIDTFSDLKLKQEAESINTWSVSTV